MAKKKRTTKKAARNESPRLILLVPVEHVSRDPISGKSTLYGLYDQLWPSDFTSGVTFKIFATLRGGVGKHSIKFGLEGANGKVFTANEGELEIACRKNKNISIVAGLVEVPIKRAGTYEVVVFCDGKRFGQSYPLSVKLKKESTK